jgi:hypothetical protein
VLSKGASKAKSAGKVAVKHVKDNKKSYAAVAAGAALSGLALYKAEKSYKDIVPIEEDGKRSMSRMGYGKMAAQLAGDSLKRDLRQKSDSALSSGKGALASGGKKLSGAAKSVKDGASKLASGASSKMQSSIEALRAFLQSKRPEEKKEKSE